MIRYTVQLHSLSGSFGSPDGKDVRYASNLSEVREILQDWADEHDQIGAEHQDAHALVWTGREPDVTDLYPCFEVTIGPRGGVHRRNC